MDLESQEKTNYSRKAFIVLFTSIFKCFLQIFSGIVTARILFPQDFGIISMAATFSSLIDVLGRFGIDSFIISSKNISKKNINSIYLLNVLIGIIITVVILIGAVPVSVFYKTPEVKYILFFGAWSFLLNSFISVPKALMLKEMRQGLVSKIEIFQGFLNVFLVIIFALCGFHYLSYVIPLLITNVVIFLIYLNVSKNKFSWEFSKSLEKDIIKQGLAYSKSFMPKAVLGFFVYNSDYMMVGYLLGSGILGLYFFGFEKALSIINMLSGLYVNMCFPLFAKLQSDKEELKSKFFSVVEKLNFAVYPLIFIQIVLAKELINFVFGTKWNDSVLTFQLILGYSFFRIAASVVNIIFDAVGKPEQNLKHFQIATPLCIVAFLIGAKFDLIGVSIAAFLVHTLLAGLIFIRACKVFNWSIKEFFNMQLKFLVPLILQLPIIIPFKMYLEKLGFPIYLNIILIMVSILGLYFIFIISFFKEVYEQICIPVINKIKNKSKKLLGFAV